jgi:hypothetical protein
VKSQVTTAHPDVTVTNALGTWRLHVKQVEQTCLRATVDGHGAAQPLDDYRCYKVVLAKGQPAWPLPTHNVADVHYPARDVVVQKPTRVCEPVTIDGDPPADPAAVSVCYGIGDVVPQAAFKSVEESVTTEFATYGVAERARPKPVLCLPSAQIVLP